MLEETTNIKRTKSINTQVIHDLVQKTALQSASKGSHFDALWHESIAQLLSKWNAEIKMDLWDATEIMLRSAGYYYAIDWVDTHPTTNYDLWYKCEEDLSEAFEVSMPFLPVPTKSIASSSFIAFRMTIAVFETINHWCNQESPSPIVFDKEHLCNTLKNRAYRSFCRLEKTTCGSMGHFAG